MEMISETELDRMVARLVRVRSEARKAVARWLGIDLPPASEADRMADLLARAQPPASCGPDMPAAPARGALVALPPMAMVQTDQGYDLRHIGHRGRDAARARDAFDQMADQARRAGGRDPFTAAQKLAGRAYATLVERHGASGLRCRSAETLSNARGGASHDGVMDILLDEARHLDRIRAAIGDGWALEVTRQSKRRRTPITERELVDAVCLEGRSVGHVLEAAGWAVYGETRAWAQQQVAAALDRMYQATSFRGLTS